MADVADVADNICAVDARDMERVTAIMTDAFDPRYGEAWSPAQCLATFALPGYRWFGARPRGADTAAPLCGFAIFRTVAGESELLLLAVESVHRRGGVASDLMHAWLATCQSSGVERAFLEVRADNPARQLYERHDFVFAACRPEYYRGQDGILRDAITMHRSIG